MEMRCVFLQRRFLKRLYHYPAIQAHRLQEGELYGKNIF